MSAGRSKKYSDVTAKNSASLVRGVPIDVRSATFDFGDLPAHEIDPRFDRLPVEPDAGNAIDHTIALVDEMGELVDADVSLVARVPKTAYQIRLGQNHQPIQAPGT